jgi:hypothetical protein
MSYVSREQLHSERLQLRRDRVCLPAADRGPAIDDHDGWACRSTDAAARRLEEALLRSALSGTAGAGAESTDSQGRESIRA